MSSGGGLSSGRCCAAGGICAGKASAQARRSVMGSRIVCVPLFTMIPPGLLYNSFMPHVDKHPPGDFCWLELGTTDQNAAKKFYGALFGWIAGDTPTGPDSYYTIFRLDGRNAAAAFTLRPEELARGIPTHWQPYIAVENADATASKVAGLGGTVLEPPFDVLDAGRMAVIRDPTGAVTSIFQARRQAGLGI